MQAMACEAAERRLPVPQSPFQNVSPRAKNFVDSLNGRHGQNALGPSRKELKWEQVTVDHIASQWYSEQEGIVDKTASLCSLCASDQENYDYTRPGPQKGCVNFIQMMWAGTTSAKPSVCVL